MKRFTTFLLEVGPLKRSVVDKVGEEDDDDQPSSEFHFYRNNK